MKAFIITCFESNDERAAFVYEALDKLGFDTLIISSDFSHIKKTKRSNVPNNCELIETRLYSRNLSVSRMYSHYCFSKDVFERIENDKADLIWLMVPANSLVMQARRYKKNHPEVKLVIDVIDMWPESLPLNVNADRFPLSIWKNIRSKNIDCCDILVSECAFYQDKLNNEYHGNIETLYWARDGKIRNEKDTDDEKLSLCYIGSISNIIDINRIVDIVSKIDYPVVFHVIGEGESQEEFVDKLNNVCETVYHGPIRDEEKKAVIFKKCHAGINIYRDNLYIGLTVKCIDYFEHGLPIINNIKGDTWNFVEKYGVGINVADDKTIDAHTLINMRKNNENIVELYKNNFTKKVFIDKCCKIVEEVMK